jgi:hypothetical protein
MGRRPFTEYLWRTAGDGAVSPDFFSHVRMHADRDCGGAAFSLRLRGIAVLLCFSPPYFMLYWWRQCCRHLRVMVAVRDAVYDER